MSTAGYVGIVIVIWAVSGIAAAAVFMGRRGRRAWYWYLLGAVLGLLFVPIAMERGNRPTSSLESRPGPDPATRAGPVRPGDGHGPKVLIGVDGSPDSDRALRTMRDVLGGHAGELILATVVDVAAQVKADERTDEEAEQLARARELLSDRAAGLAADRPAAPTGTEILTGQPARALLDVARSRDVDMIVIGRRGSGLSHRLLGSVADQLVRDATRPVLLAAAEDA
ncbi:universal stress protein [Micromonospora sp. LOL_023]|uniref:universal stress protein n=1 Tax=Micromonospora sp. LOL_023 TaxID=3345418 RepID=UPI003A87E821